MIKVSDNYRRKPFIFLCTYRVRGGSRKKGWGGGGGGGGGTGMDVTWRPWNTSRKKPPHTEAAIDYLFITLQTKLPYSLDQTPHSNSHRTRIVAALE